MSKSILRLFAVLIFSLGLLSLLMIFMSEINSAEFYISIITFVIDFIVFIFCILLNKRKAGE